MKPFDFVNSVNFTKKNMMRGTENDDLAEKSYVPYLTNKALSYHTDTLLYANEMNQLHFLDNKLQYEFFLNTLRKKKRFAKWAKADNNDDIEMISQYFKYSPSKAKIALTVLTSQQLEEIRERFTRGIENDRHN